MNKIKFCIHCFDKVEHQKEVGDITYKIKGNTFKWRGEKWICSNCGGIKVEDDVYDIGLKKGFEKFGIERGSEK